MQRMEIDPTRPVLAVVEQAARLLSRGGVVALPTETFYGLAVDARDPQAIAALNQLKGKPADAPMLLLAADGAQVERLALVEQEATALIERHWPGPLTLVLPARAAPGTVGLRVPGLALPRALARALGHPITGTSANRHGATPACSAAAVIDELGDSVDLVLDGGPTPGGVPSSLVDLSVSPPRLLRNGAVPIDELRRLLPALEIPSL